MSDTYSSDQEKLSRAKSEERILEFWREHNIFQKTLEKDSPEGEFVFFEGPPTANGRPGIHHLESRSFKDAIPRFKTMQGFHVPRKAGWDTHGLPVELEVEKDLDLSTKGEVKDYGVAEFNEKCKESVWQYIEEWEAFTKRMGYWLDLDDPYITYKSDYIESVWHRLSQAEERDLLYKDYKVVPWCPRCETTLSSHELAQGYKTVKHLAVTAKFKLIDPPEEIVAGESVYLLAWTTTPWTLPANLALAVNGDINYALVDDGENHLIVAEELVAEVVGENTEIKATFSGDKLVGLSYEPLYDFAGDVVEEEQASRLKENAFKVYEADFVTTEEGTGIVHTAVMYGQDDFALGDRVNLPRLHMVDQTGHFKDGTDWLAGRFVHDEEVAVDIIKDLYHRNEGGETGLLFEKGKHEHEYPHCWRCKTPLIYYARDSWYIAMTELREELLAENQEINWEPEHLKDGRFGEWLDGVQDWAISRERFWGTPLPIWESEDGETREVINSLAQLKEKTKSTNRFFLMRHGESINNKKEIISGLAKNDPGMTDKGRAQTIKAAEKLAQEEIDVIITSPLPRTRETAELMADELGLSEGEIIKDDRIRENEFGELEGTTHEEYYKFYESRQDRFDLAPEGGENWHEVKKRVTEALYDIDSKYDNKNILFVSHKGPIEMLQAGSQVLDDEQTAEFVADPDFGPDNAEVRELEFAPLPHNEDYELDLHRPYVDEITWKNDDGQKMRRVPEVMDVWFDSGSVPFAQHHYPFENKDYVEKEGYPADFIAEAIDQTRGWFYTMHAIGALSGMGKAYKNVICLGHILDAEGNKMSKSVGNTVNPWNVMNEFGADAVRFWMYSINQPGESKNFSRDTVDEVVKKVFNLIENITRFYLLYGGEAVSKDELRDPYKSPSILDHWLLLKLDRLIKTATNSLESYDLLTPTRAIRSFVGDFSRWYIRRSRERFKTGGDSQLWALSTTQHVLETLVKLLAPFTPFLAEDIYQEIALDKKESVHLADWPQNHLDKHKDTDQLLSDMEFAREIASTARDLRSQAGIKVRQPLSTLRVSSQKSEIRNQDQFIELIKDEVNVKTIEFGADIENVVELDTEITDELAREGAVRELIRQIQRLRKKADLDPTAEKTITVATDKKGKKLIKEYKDEITETATLSEISFGKVTEGSTVDIHEFNFTVKLSE